jgi:hypothetical protein
MLFIRLISFIYNSDLYNIINSNNNIQSEVYTEYIKIVYNGYYKNLENNYGKEYYEEVMKKLTLDKEQDINYERERNRLFTNFRMNRRV